MSKSIMNTTKYVCSRCGAYGYTEVFKEIPNYEGRYLIGSRGTILSTEFRNNVAKKKRIKELTPTDNGKGYKIIFLGTGNGKKREYVHRLVASAFILQPNGKTVINHKDHNKGNNCVSNLEWCTQSENVRYSAEQMRHAKSKCKKTSTGYKYIHHSQNGMKYRLLIRKRGKCVIDKTFDDLDSAIARRDEVINGKINP